MKIAVVIMPLLLVCLFLPGVAGAQSAANSGQIGGEVRDPSGAAIAGLEVTARNVDTNLTRAASTDGEGRYAIGLLPVGTYEVMVKPANVEVATQRVYVSLGGRADATFKLGLRQVQESVDVMSNGSAIEPAQTFFYCPATSITAGPPRSPSQSRTPGRGSSS